MNAISHGFTYDLEILKQIPDYTLSDDMKERKRCLLQAI